MALTDATLKAAKPKDKPYRLADKDSLYAQISPAGGVSWRFNFMFAGKQKTLSLGQWPAVKIGEARRRLKIAKGQLSQGIDPAAEKQARKRPNRAADRPTFEQAARAWHAAQIQRWTDDYAAQVLTRLEADVFEHIGKKRFAEIERSDILACLRDVEARGVLETARRLRQYIGAIHRYAGAVDDSIKDPTPMLKGALKPPGKGKHYKRLAFERMGDFLRKLATYETEFEGEAETRLAIEFTILNVARTCETINAEWTQFSNWQRASPDALWRVPEEIMKMDDPHLVPLSTQATALLRELHELTLRRPDAFSTEPRLSCERRRRGTDRRRSIRYKTASSDGWPGSTSENRRRASGKRPPRIAPRATRSRRTMLTSAASETISARPKRRERRLSAHRRTPLRKRCLPAIPRRTMRGREGRSRAWARGSQLLKERWIWRGPSVQPWSRPNVRRMRRSATKFTI